jgi:predicted RNase H-like nuclease (RuvC/YqgF family)
MRADDNCKFKLHKTATCDWYGADEVDARIAELEQELADSKKNINSLCNTLESTLKAIDASGKKLSVDKEVNL